MNFRRFAFSLALIVVLSPAATDMYLVSMPDIAKHFDASYALVQLSLTVFLFAQGAGQLLFGPVIDRLGRRFPMLIGLVVFMFCSVYAGVSQSIFVLIISRFIQGLSGALLLVIGFSSVRDVAEKDDAARMYALLLTIEGLTPVFAPIIGGYIDTFFGWRAVLFASAVMAVIALVNSVLNMKETLPLDKRIPLRPDIIWQTYLKIFADKKFLLPVIALSLVFFYLFAYVSGSAYLYQTIYGLSPDSFGLAFGLTGAAIILGAIVNSRIKLYNLIQVAMAGTIMIFIGTLISFIMSFSIGVYGIIAGFTISMFGLGLAEPSLISMTMSSQKTAFGFTAALMGAIHLMFGSLSTPVSGVLLPVNITHWFIFLIATAVLIILSTRIAARKT